MPSHILHPDIPYTTVNHHTRQVLDLYIPAPESTAAQATSSLPVIVYIHGGAFKFGSKESRLLPLRQIENGYAIAALNYRRSGEAIFPAMIEDCKSAVRFLKSASVVAQYGLDPNRVAVWGESAGGHAAAFLGSTSQPKSSGRYDVGEHLEVSSSVIGVVDYYGPTNFLEMDEHLPEGFQTHNDAGSPESLYLGKQITEISEKVKEADPCTYLEEMVEKYVFLGKCPAFFIAHGTMDRIVPEHMSRLLIKELEKHHVSYEYIPVEGTDHVFERISEEQQKQLDKRTDTFLHGIFREQN